MCGIAGFIGTQPGDYSVRVPPMLGALRHRGPDSSGSVVGDFGQIGMTRLSIVDVEGGDQPFLNETQDLAIVGNGEIYNATELREELELRGHRFRSRSDIEVALHLYEEYREAAFKRLNGMFALAIFNLKLGSLTLVRDRFGIKPLVYAQTQEGLIFASEVSALVAGLGRVSSTILEEDEQALFDYLSHGYIPGEQTVYRGVRKLPPGSIASYEAGRFEVSSWYSWPELSKESDPLVPSEERRCAEELAELISSSVSYRAIGDVEAGAFLSGGLDSSSLVTVLARATESTVPVFTLGINDPASDELETARLTAGRLGCRFHGVRLGVPKIEDLDRLFRHFGEPFGDTSLVTVDRIAQLASQHVKFVISGDGGDELFAGYSWFLLEAKLSRLPAPLRMLAQSLRPWLKRAHTNRGAGQLARLARGLGDLAVGPVESFLRRRQLTSGRYRSRLLGERFGSFETTLERHLRSQVDVNSTLSALLDLDRKFYLTGDILEKVDRATMRHSLEARVPYLDHRIVELAARVPLASHLGEKGRGKSLLRQAFGEILPPELLRLPKRGFGLPVDSWLRGELGADLKARLLDRSFLSRKYVQPRELETLIEEHRDGDARHGQLLWSLLSLATFQSTRPEPAELRSLLATSR